MAKILFKDKYRIRSIRLPGWDYAAEGCYFITICAKNRENYFGKIIDNKMRLSAIGEIIREQWFATRQMRQNIILDEFVIMPNHLHGIIIFHDPKQTGPIDCQDIINDFCLPIERDLCANAAETHGHASLPIGQKNNQPLYKNNFGPQRKNLGSVIRGFKGKTRKIINEKFGKYHFAWQPGYYDDIIKNERMLLNVRYYIINNPAKWQFDSKNKLNKKTYEKNRINGFNRVLSAPAGPGRPKHHY